MSDNACMLLVFVVFSIAMLALGATIEKKYITGFIPRIAEQQWMDGCNKCAQFEKAACERDQIQGVKGPDIIQ